MVKQYSNGKVSQSLDQTSAMGRPEVYPGGGPTWPNYGLDDNGASLGIPVPDSLVITAAAYRKFMSKNRLDEVVEGLLEGVDVTSIEELQHPAAQIKGIIHTSPLPEPMCSRIYTACQRLGDGVTTIVWPVALPSELRTSKEIHECPYLKANSSEELMGAIKTWWASLFDASAILAREANKQGHRDTEITLAAQQVPGPAQGRMLRTFAVTFPRPGAP